MARMDLIGDKNEKNQKGVHHVDFITDEKMLAEVVFCPSIR
jgi:hypothetical protein